MAEKASATKPGVLDAAAASLKNAGTYLLTGTLIRLFWLFEGTMDIRAWGMENLRLLHRRGERPLVVLWHGKGFVPIAYFHRERLCLYASHSRSPDYKKTLQALRWLTLRMIERLGYTVLDASQFKSESRGVLKFVQTLRDDSGGVIAADGPGGPIYEAKPGAGFLGQKSGVVLLPVGCAVSSGVRLDQWDQFEIPRLFSRATLVVGEPIPVPKEASDEELDAMRLGLEAALNRATWKAEEKLGLNSGAIKPDGGEEVSISGQNATQPAAATGQLQPLHSGSRFSRVIEFLFDDELRQTMRETRWTLAVAVAGILMIAVTLIISLQP